jgi:hypothetical protein
VVVLSALGWAAHALYGQYSEKEKQEQDRKALIQIGFALRGYHDHHGSFPAGSSLIDGHPADKGHSWMAHLLPYMEQVNVYQQVDFKKPWDHPSNAAAARTPYEFFNGVKHETNESPYLGIAGVGTDAAGLPATDPRVGLFGYRRVTRARDITDGADTTIMVVEANKDRGPWPSGGNATVRGLDPAGRRYVGKDGQFGREGGAMILYANGSVRWISDSIGAKVLEALATIHGGEEVSPEYRVDPPNR